MQVNRSQISYTSTNNIINLENQIDIKQFKKIDNYVYRGAQPSPEQLSKLKELGVTTVFDFRTDNHYKNTSTTEEDVAKKLGLKYIHLPFPSTENPKKEDVDKFFERINNIRNKNEKAYIHCQYGKDRTGLFSAMYQLKYDQKPLDKCIEEMYEIGHDGIANPTLVPFLRDYNENLKYGTNINLDPTAGYNRAMISLQNKTPKKNIDEINKFVNSFCKESNDSKLDSILIAKYPELSALSSTDKPRFDETMNKIKKIKQIINYDYEGYNASKPTDEKITPEEFKQRRCKFYTAIRTPAMLNDFISYFIPQIDGIERPKNNTEISNVIDLNPWLINILK